MNKDLIEAITILKQMIDISVTADGANHLALAGTYIMKLKPLLDLHEAQWREAQRNQSQ
jgi:hypothetical protein